MKRKHTVRLATRIAEEADDLLRLFACVERTGLGDAISYAIKTALPSRDELHARLREREATA